MKLFHLPLERYKSRYTDYLEDIEQEVFSSKFDVETIHGASEAVLDIMSGQVLDSIQRPLQGLSQTAEVLKRIKANPLSSLVWCSDFYHPGLSALAYSRLGNRTYSFLWAQTFDRFDFTNEMPWMRDWEKMALKIYHRTFVASELLGDFITTAVPEAEGKIEVVGLPFDSKKVFALLETPAPNRDIDVVFTSRFDGVKNPDFFLTLVESCPDLTFAICTGLPTLSGNADEEIQRAKELAVSTEGRLTIFENCTKQEYFRVLTRSKIQFNCAFQDWVSFTLLEALTFGCIPIYPMFRSFVEVFDEFPNYLYGPSFMEQAVRRIFAALEQYPKMPAAYERMRSQILTYHDGTLHRVAKIIASLNES